MKTILFFMTLLMPFTVISANEDFVCAYKRIKVCGGTVVRKALYNGETVMASYDPSGKTLTVCFHYNMDNAEVVIMKNGEVVASDVFDMEVEEDLEYDLSECGE